MAFSVDEFRADLKYDGARASLFEVALSIPTFIPGNANSPVNRDITFKARATSLPGDTVSSITVPYFGREVKVAGARTFPDWSITVINDEDFNIRSTMEEWMSGINTHVTNLRTPGAGRTFNTTGDYAVDGYVYQYSKGGDMIKSYIFHNMFPVEVAPIDLDWGSADSIEEFQITFAYQYWLANDTQTI